MRRLFTTRSIAGLIAALALLVLIAGPAAMAQTGSGGTGSSASGNKGGTGPLPAPVGHRQPRAGDVPPEKNLSNPNDPVNKEDAALDKRIKSICRGC
jgi:hypothetical protein